MQSSPAAAILLADLVAGRTSSLPTETIEGLSPERFR